MPRKAKPLEKLTSTNLDRVIALLGQDKPITKKAACEILGIAYNTTRLENLISSHKEAKKRDEEQRAKKKNTPATNEEIGLAISSYLEGKPISSISKMLYRSDYFINSILERANCPKRATTYDYLHPELIPESLIKEHFSPGEKVWAARYNCLATIKQESEKQKGVYLIWLDAEEWQQHAYQPWWELGSLETIIKTYGVYLQ